MLRYFFICFSFCQVKLYVIRCKLTQSDLIFVLTQSLLSVLLFALYVAITFTLVLFQPTFMSGVIQRWVSTFKREPRTVDNWSRFIAGRMSFVLPSRVRRLKGTLPVTDSSLLKIICGFDTIGWVPGRASGL